MIRLPAIPVQGTSLAEQALNALEHMLVTLQLEPGMILREQELAHDLGLGRTPVREAVLRLSESGMLSVIPRKGIQVSTISRSDLAQVIETRRVLERLLVVKAAERANEAQRKELRDIAKQLAAPGLETNRFYNLDRQLDDVLEAAGGNPYLVKALSPLHIHCRRLWYLLRDETDQQQSAQLHAQLAQAVANNDGAGAIRSLNGIISVLELQLGQLKAYG